MQYYNNVTTIAQRMGEGRNISILLQGFYTINEGGIK